MLVVLCVCARARVHSVESKTDFITRFDYTGPVGELRVLFISILPLIITVETCNVICIAIISVLFYIFTREDADEHSVVFVHCKICAKMAVALSHLAAMPKIATSC
jgi:hypothetical protein